MIETTEDFVRKLYLKYKNEIDFDYERLEGIRNKLIRSSRETLPKIRRTPEGLIKGSTSIRDCVYLYLLIRYFKPNIIFEIGTWIGTSTAIMAEALRKNNSGKIITCDINNYVLILDDYQDKATYYNMHSSNVLKLLLKQNIEIEFVFNDASITKSTIKRLQNLVSKNFIFLTHDYKPPKDKGIKCVKLMDRHFVKGSNEFKWFLPNKIDKGYDVGANFTINRSTALLISKNLLKDF